MKKNLDRVGNVCRLCMMGDPNGWVRGDITGAFRVPGENENEWRVLDFCAEQFSIECFIMMK